MCSIRIGLGYLGTQGDLNDLRIDSYLLRLLLGDGAHLGLRFAPACTGNIQR